jgi:hypothetical protein
MSQSDKDHGLPLGDASHILDNEPKPTVERTVMPVPLSQRTVTPDGEVVRDAQPGDRPIGVLPGEVVRGISSEQRIKDAKVIAEPCPDCRFFSWPDQDEMRWIEGFLSNYFGGIPSWMAPHVPGRNPKEYGMCKGAPHGKCGPVHMVNSCSSFRSKVGVKSKRGLIARMFGRHKGN